MGEKKNLEILITCENRKEEIEEHKLFIVKHYVFCRWIKLRYSSLC